MRRCIAIFMLFVIILSLSACGKRVTYSEGNYSDHACEYPGCDNKSTILIYSNRTGYDWYDYYCSDHSEFAQHHFDYINEIGDNSSDELGSNIVGGFVLIPTFIYLFYLATKTKSILFLVGKTAIFGIVALIVVSIIGTMLTSGHFFLGFILLALIFLAYVSLS